MKGILKKIDGKWIIKYLDWGYEPTGEKNTLGNYEKKLKEFTIELDPSDSKDADSLEGTKQSLDGKDVRFAFKEDNGLKYARLKKPSADYQLDEIEQEILNDTFKKSIKYTPTISSRLTTQLGHSCIICENAINLSDSKQLCDECLDALKSLIQKKEQHQNNEKTSRNNKIKKTSYN